MTHDIRACSSDGNQRGHRGMTLNPRGVNQSEQAFIHVVRGMARGGGCRRGTWRCVWRVGWQAPTSLLLLPMHKAVNTCQFDEKSEPRYPCVDRKRLCFKTATTPPLTKHLSFLVISYDHLWNEPPGKSWWDFLHWMDIWQHDMQRAGLWWCLCSCSSTQIGNNVVMMPLYGRTNVFLWWLNNDFPNLHAWNYITIKVTSKGNCSILRHQQSITGLCRLWHYVVLRISLCGSK